MCVFVPAVWFDSAWLIAEKKIAFISVHLGVTLFVNGKQKRGAAVG